MPAWQIQVKMLAFLVMFLLFAAPVQLFLWLKQLSAPSRVKADESGETQEEGKAGVQKQWAERYSELSRTAELGDISD